MGRFQISFLFLVACICSASLGFTCKQAERNALLKLKHSFIDESNTLSSWVGQDCCSSWEGVGCHNVTGNVIILDLSSSYFQLEATEVNPALLQLKYLTYLDLSFVDFNGLTFPDFFGSMRQLKHLDLSHASFRGKLPNVLGNLTDLVFLDLNSYCWPNCEMERNDIEWASKLVNLKYLDLSGIDLSQALDSLNILYKLSSLLDLTLFDCQLGNSHQILTNSTVSSPMLQHLELGSNLFSGLIPPFIHNLSSIRFLDLSYNHLSSSIPTWLVGKTYLEYLSLGSNNFSRVDGGVMSIISRLCRLKHLDLSYNQLQEEVSEFHVYNFSMCSRYDLAVLDMNNNKISGYLPIIGSLSSLLHLDLSYNQLEHIPPSLERLLSLSSLNLSNNNFAVVPEVIGSVSSLQTLDLSHNNLEALPPSMWELSSLVGLFLSHNHFRVVSPLIGSLSSLESLDLSDNNLEALPPSLGTLSSLYSLNLSQNNFAVLPPSMWGLSSLDSLDLSHNSLSVVSPVIESFSSLKTLDLSNNNLETLPSFLGGLSSLNSLYLSYNNLSIVHQVSFANLSSLDELDLSSNSAILDFSPNWIPPFQLRSLSILPCKLNSPFPKWILSRENLGELDLSNSGIFGPLPNNIGKAMASLQSLRLANNHINGSIPRSLCEVGKFLFEGVIDLQNNQLLGIIPDCWANSHIAGVDLSSNRLSGRIPNSLTKAVNLQLLSLNNNSLEGELPLHFNSFGMLTIFDVGRNNLYGEIPPWNGTYFPLLQILILRENKLKGTIPPQLCSLPSLKIIDLASNSMVGSIPRCFGKFQGMSSMQTSPYVNIVATVDPNEWSAAEVIKGEEREYTTILHLLVNMDLSCNKLVGVIPTQISNLSYLLGLNLSHNQLTGTIPREIGKMVSLESLDLSFNNLSGSIPEGMSSLDSLSTMSLSFNNLQGKIPTGRHFQTLEDPSIYMGNPGLCGDHLSKKCSGDNSGAYSPTSMVDVEDEGDNKHDKMWFYLIIMSGFATGFWGVIGILVAHKRWRTAYFRIAEELADWIYVEVAVRIARANRGR